MRSRYTAYALGGFGEYLLETWFPATAQGLTVAELSNGNVDWEKLEVLNKYQRGDEGTVEFKAYFRNKTSGEDDKQGLEIMHEISEFRRISGRWYYVGGQVSQCFFNSILFQALSRVILHQTIHKQFFNIHTFYMQILHIKIIHEQALYMQNLQ